MFSTVMCHCVWLAFSPLGLPWPVPSRGCALTSASLFISSLGQVCRVTWAGPSAAHGRSDPEINVPQGGGDPHATQRPTGTRILPAKLVFRSMALTQAGIKAGFDSSEPFQ